MSWVDTLKEALPDYAKDTKLNLDAVIKRSSIPEVEANGCALAAAMATGNGKLLTWIASTFEDVQFPFYCIGTTKQIGQLDANGKPLVDANGQPVVANRLTALSAFKTREEIKKAHADSALLDIEIAQEIRDQATTAGLSQEAVNALASVAF